ncbi:MAG: tetratricopeptide repeat protein [Treponema sp.]|nr:tetratricopeptide repeat protein [Treponema sp.]
MGKLKKDIIRISASFLLALGFIVPLSALEGDFEQGSTAYREGDWISARYFLRRSLDDPGHDSEGTRYMLIMSHISLGDYSSAIADCDSFAAKFPESGLGDTVYYQKGRSLHLMGKNEEAIPILSSLSEKHGSEDLGPSATYWLGECYYALGDYDTAASLYERVAKDFSETEKAPDAEKRLQEIARGQNIDSLRKDLAAAKMRIAELERESELNKNALLRAQEQVDEANEQARQTRQMLDEANEDARRRILEAQTALEQARKAAENAQNEAERERLRAEMEAEQNRLNALLEAEKTKSQTENNSVQGKLDALKFKARQVQLLAEKSEIRERQEDELRALKTKAAFIQALLEK